MRISRLAAILLAAIAAPAWAQYEEDHGYLTGLETNVVRAQLVPLRKGVFSAGIGAIVEHINVQEGDVVQRGDLMLEFNCDRVLASRDTAQARVERAKATLQVNRELLKLNSVGPLEVQLNEADLAVARGELNLVLSQLKHCRIEAPFAGAVTMRAVEEHQFAAEGDPLLELVARDSLEARMLMPSTSLVWLQIGIGFRMHVEELNKPIEGKVVRIGGAVDPVSLTVSVFGVLSVNNSDLLPGMSGRVEFIPPEDG